ncbi:type II toxin-antitoxin system prevent-host-death family antitoxin [Trinickia caryophylli]|nr:type II toxin-antitoxin system prevent-host-death family antitoxin [Trinickia caryophylli]WQE12026.1 type II toxin-antitoxin system prevent-host-death family antitoxin [Trinickia caryophylli]
MKILFQRHALAMAAREFSKNPSKALREANDHPVMVTKYGQPIACLVSIEHWNDLIQEQRNRVLEERINEVPCVAQSG